MFASIKSVTSRNFLSSLKDCFAMLYLMVYRQKQLCKYLFSQLLQFFHVTIVCHFNNTLIMFFAKLFIFINMVFLDMLNEKRFENYLLFPIFATNIFLLWYNLTCFFKSHFSRNLSSQISKAVCYGIFSYASSSRLRKILSRKMIQLRNLCSPSSPMSPWSWRSPWSIMCLQWQQRFSHY